MYSHALEMLHQAAHSKMDKQKDLNNFQDIKINIENDQNTPTNNTKTNTNAPF